MGPCTQLPMSPRALSRSEAASHALPCSHPWPSCCLQLNHCPGIWQAALCPASPSLFAIAPRLGRAKGSGDTWHCQADAAPCPGQASASLTPQPPCCQPTGPRAWPKAPHTPWGQFSLPKPCLPPQSMSDPRGTEQPVGCGFQSSQCSDTVSLPSHVVGGLCSRAGLASGPGEQTRGGSAHPHASTARSPGRANKSAPCAGRAAGGCIPANLLLQAAYPWPPTTMGPGPGRGGKWGGQLAGLCPASLPPSPEAPRGDGISRVVGFQAVVGSW